MNLTALSPLDNRYTNQLQDLVPYLSHYALIAHRVRIEIEWLRFQSEHPELTHVRTFTQKEQDLLQSWINTFDEQQAERVVEIEKTTNHDVKSVEYYVKERLVQTSMADVCEAVHFCCTSEDINNLSHALMLKSAVENVYLPLAQKLINAVSQRANKTQNLAMLSHTHGQPATPTTLGKELAVFVYRWQRQIKQFKQTEYLGKFNGATGNYNAHVAAYPNLPWQDIAQTFIERLGLTFNPLTTQIEPHDYMAELFHAFIRFNTIALDFARDMWAYISLRYIVQKALANEVGSSTMPHKVNPIDFENAEANLGVSTSIFEHLATKLPVSRLQRDLSDSSTLRNIGPAIGHSCVALQSLLKGLNKTAVDNNAIKRDFENEWEVLGEAVQTVMRKTGYENPYEQMKALTRGTNITHTDLQTFIQTLDLPKEDSQRLQNLTPETYIGLAPQLVNHIL
ncbi:MAG: adenylosuccinate lyase [Candidatus Latescibacteria bacterium]|jgi:adenylosuccinate lyase|nr:adenylosuccinate lyase [Candidatus Latescibacterota bacterium]